MKKIMFSDAFQLTQAVLDLIKTKTRRVISNKLWEKWDKVKHPESTEEDMIQFFLDNSPYKVGEVVAVAQSYKDCGFDPEAPLMEANGIGGYVKTKFSPGWNNKLFVRSDLMKHFIRITDVRVERLKDISEDDCLAEGVGISATDNRIGTPFSVPFNYYIGKDEKGFRYTTPREAYAALIDRISGKGTWQYNPYVFVYEFELIK